ncbi:hypothetical protein [Streptomyces sp. NPDC013455]|uniref:hypothetical protein n=1 Tax=Streptomyces sp. NPDC013455 TaxID=3155605 RepID=UPI0033E54DE0
MSHHHGQDHDHDHPDPEPEDPTGTTGRHGMLVFGRDVIYFSHLAMYHVPHNYQAVFEVDPDDGVRERIRSHRHAIPQEPYDTFDPVPFPMAEIDPAGSGPRRTSIRGNLYCGHFERRARGTEPLARDIEVRIERVARFTELDVNAQATGDGPLEYLCFGHGDRLYLAHAIGGWPNFDQILEVHAVPGTATNRMGEPLPDDASTMERFFREHFTTADPFDVIGRSDDPDHRLVSHEVVGGSFLATSPPSGIHGFRVQLAADREVYLEIGELAHPMG